MISNQSKHNLLIVGNFASNTGYAWKTIFDYFVALADMFFEAGSKAFICFPEIRELPNDFQYTKLKAVELDFSKIHSLPLYQFIRNNHIKILYLTDRPIFSLRYLICRLAGVRKIVLHDRTSGNRDRPGMLKRLLKNSLNRYPILSVDVVIAISDFVKQRLIQVACFPKDRIIRIWNGVDIEKFKRREDDFVFKKYKIPREKKLVFAYSRANKYKGIQVLIECANIIIKKKGRNDVFFLYCGDGPDLGNFRALIKKQNLADCFLCPGESNGIERILNGVDTVVVPSIWQEGFGLSVIEGMASEKVVIASRVGGIPEIISDTKNGFLVPPADSSALSRAIMRVLENERLAKEIRIAARKTVLRHFNIQDKKRELLALFRTLCSEIK